MGPAGTGSLRWPLRPPAHRARPFSLALRAYASVGLRETPADPYPCRPSTPGCEATYGCWRRPWGWVRKSLPEVRACVSARTEGGSGEHGVRDRGFADPVPTVGRPKHLDLLSLRRPDWASRGLPLLLISPLSKVSGAPVLFRLLLPSPAPRRLL